MYWGKAQHFNKKPIKHLGASGEEKQQGGGGKKNKEKPVNILKIRQ